MGTPENMYPLIPPTHVYCIVLSHKGMLNLQLVVLPERL